MSPNTITYLIFLLIAVTVYYLLPAKLRNAFLLAASMVFYMWSMPQYAIIVAFVAVFSFFAAKLIEKTDTEKKRSGFLALSIIVCLSFLLVFKYYNFFMDEITALLSYAGVTIAPTKLTWLQPLGISFYTFQVVGYLIDVRNKKVESERNFINYALFVTFFPQILAGPIGRAGELLTQYRETHRYEYSNIVEGLQRFLTGAFKKVVIADGLGKIIDGVYGNLPEYEGAILIFSVFGYALQIYFDFSGYSDMAIGSAKLLGFTLRENFKTPYFATNMGDFWSRWHMSLTSWLRDYIYIPLGGNRKGFLRKLLNVLIVFFISGLWHGASENYVIWGLWLGVIRVIEELITKARGKKKTDYVTKAGRIIGAVYTDIAVVIGWVFFRLTSLSDVKYVFSHMFNNFSLTTLKEQLKYLISIDISVSNTFFGIFTGLLFIGFVVVAMLEIRIFLALKKDSALANNPLSLYKTKARWALYWIMGLSTALFYIINNSGANSASQFIYMGY